MKRESHLAHQVLRSFAIGKFAELVLADNVFDPLDICLGDMAIPFRRVA